MQMIPVVSEAINAVGYDPDTRLLKITFKNQKTYDYHGVPSHVFEGLMRAPSKGRYYRDHIEGKY